MTQVSPSSVSSKEDLAFMWAILEGLVPSQHHQSVIKQAVTALHKLHMPTRKEQPFRKTTTPVYNVLHLRIEDDWLAHCQR